MRCGWCASPKTGAWPSLVQMYPVSVALTCLPNTCLQNSASISSVVETAVHLLDKVFPPRYNGETGTQQKYLCGILFLSPNSLTVSLIVAVELNRRYMWMSGFCMDCRLHPIVGHYVPIRGGRVEALLQSDPPGENRSWARWTLCWPGSLHCCWRIGWSLNKCHR